MFTRLCVALDRLSNANFTPSAAGKTLSVVSTAPALAMEEALPISVSSETQQTPEEVGEWMVLRYRSIKVIGRYLRERVKSLRMKENENAEQIRENEIMEQAKKARRHAKKIRAENELHERAAYDEKARRILENRKIKESLEVTIEKGNELQAKNVTKGKESSKSDDFKSTAFFKKLQDMVTDQFCSFIRLCVRISSNYDQNDVFVGQRRYQDAHVNKVVMYTDSDFCKSSL